MLLWSSWESATPFHMNCTLSGKELHSIETLTEAKSIIFFKSSNCICNTYWNWWFAKRCNSVLMKLQNDNTNLQYISASFPSYFNCSKNWYRCSQSSGNYFMDSPKILWKNVQFWYCFSIHFYKFINIFQ